MREKKGRREIAEARKDMKRAKEGSGKKTTDHWNWREKGQADEQIKDAYTKSREI